MCCGAIFASSSVNRLGKANQHSLEATSGLNEINHTRTHIYEHRMKLIQLPVMIIGCVFAASVFADSQNPSTPDNVSASPLSDTSVRVSWNAAWDDTGVTGYNVYRDNGYYATVSATNYIDTSVSSGSTHQYKIAAFDAAQNYSPTSNSAQATASASGSITGAVTPSTDSNGAVSVPTGLQVSVINGNELQLQWAQAANASGYNVYRDDNYLTTVNSSTNLRDAVEWGRDYRYSVSSFNSNNQHSSKSAEVVGNSAGTSNAQAQAPVQAAAQPQNDGNNNNSGGVPAGYNLVFNDEFQNYSLDSSKWNSQYRWGPDLIINNERQYYVDTINQPDFGLSPFEFDGEHMTINAIRTPDWLKERAKWQPYLSGAITTYNKFTMRYGYVEMRAKMPTGRGMWPAFWLLHNQDHDRRPEIDVVELLGHQPNVLYNTYHRFDNGNLVSTPSFQVSGPDYSADFHTYAVRWEPGLLVWFVDGIERNRFSDGNVSHEDMYLLLNLAVGGWWPGDPDGSTPFPARYTIDYIRAYKKP